MAGLRVGLLGGTFDPVHFGHLIIGEHARQQLSLDKVIYLPAGEPWRKAGRAVSASEHRVAMTSLAVADNPAFVLDDREVRRPGPTYTIDTLRSLRGELGSDAELYLVLGTDALADLPNWKEPDAIREQARLIAVPRLGGDLPAGIPGSNLEKLDMPYIGISSTDIRRRVGAGLSIRYLVPDSVRRYIEEKQLYQSGE